MMRIGLLGYGVVGGGVDAIIRKRTDMEVKKVMSLVVTDECRDRIVTSVEDIWNDPEIDTVVECMGGTEPAFSFVSGALKHGKNVVTSNKALVACYYTELLELARENGVAFRSSAAVGGGIPWLPTLEAVKRFDTVRKISGVMNGTTNYILTGMSAEHLSYETALKGAQERGFAERDPSADVDGLDTARKICISANVAFDAVINETDIPVFGIRNVNITDIKAAEDMGYAIKLLASAEKASGGISAYTEPAFVPLSDPAAHIDAQFNIFMLETELFEKQSLIGEGAGRYPTAGNIVRDLSDILKGVRSFYAETGLPQAVDNSDVLHPYYVRTSAPDAFLSGIAAEKHSYYVITRPVSVTEMHAWVRRQLEKDPGLFIAGIR